MPVLNAVAVADSYADNAKSGISAAIISQVYNSRGGWFSITGAGVFVQMQYGPQGASYWTQEVQVGNGAFAYLDKACTGVRFRNAVAGQSATVTAQISQGDEPPLSIIALGSVTVAGVSAVTRQIFTTAISGGVNIPYTLPNGVTAILVECVGSGAGGGGVNVTVAGQVAIAGGGGGGSYAAKVIPVTAFTAPGSLRVNVGSGGSGGVGAAAGGNGDVSNLNETGGAGTLVQAVGGTGGLAGTMGAAPQATNGGAGGAGATGIGDLLVDGGGGGPGMALAAGAAASTIGGAGGAGGVYGSPKAGGNGLAFNGAVGSRFGGGGTGAGRSSSTASQTGGTGGDGVVVITEFY